MEQCKAQRTELVLYCRNPAIPCQDGKAFLTPYIFFLAWTIANYFERVPIMGQTSATRCSFVVMTYFFLIKQLTDQATSLKECGEN